VTIAISWELPYNPILPPMILCYTSVILYKSLLCNYRKFSSWQASLKGGQYPIGEQSQIDGQSAISGHPNLEKFTAN